MKRLRRHTLNLKKDIRGMTLAEGMAGAAILLIGALILSSGFGMAIRLMYRGDLIKQAGEQAFGVSQGAANPDGAVNDSGVKGGDVVLTLENGKKITVAGSYRKLSAGEGPYARLELLGMVEDPADLLYRQTGIAFEFAKSLTTPEERQKWGFNGNGYINNEAIRSYVYKYLWNAEWPVFPNELLERNGFKTSTVYYMQQRMFMNAYGANKNVYDPQLCSLVFARTDPSDKSNWNAPLIYDSEFRIWYYRAKTVVQDQDGAIVSQDPAGGTGAKAILEHVRSCPNWVALK